jgi:hypothetical protein
MDVAALRIVEPPVLAAVRNLRGYKAIGNLSSGDRLDEFNLFLMLYTLIEPKHHLFDLYHIIGLFDITVCKGFSGNFFKSLAF